MLKNDKFFEFIKKILSDDTNEDKLEEQARKMALKKPEKTKEGYLLVDLVEEKTEKNLTAPLIKCVR